MDDKTLNKIKEKVEQVEREGHGNVNIIIKNGYVYRITKTDDELLKEDK